ncbi:MAG TPA: type 1 glutamine amidotransferase domain-containing protein [Rhizomicrobium sp.]|jgi:protease I|nr:type 1 glutamine amidotransferase domain-containing protein [Rhizomicrobium sp.]
MTDIAKARILIIATNGFEQSELEVPRDQLRAKGATVQVATPDGKDIKGWQHTDWGRVAPADLKIADAKMEDYTALVIPGGVMNPDKLRVDEDAMTIVKAFLGAGKVVAAICHGPWLLVQADALKGRQATSYKSIRKDVENSGATWLDEKVVVDNGIVTSRSPDDLDAFVGKIVEEIEEGKHYRRQAA